MKRLVRQIEGQAVYPQPAFGPFIVWISARYRPRLFSGVRPNKATCFGAVGSLRLHRQIAHKAHSTLALLPPTLHRPTLHPTFSTTFTIHEQCLLIAMRTLPPLHSERVRPVHHDKRAPYRVSTKVPLACNVAKGRCAATLVSRNAQTVSRARKVCL